MQAKPKNKGFVAILVTIIILVAMITISHSVSGLVIAQHRISADVLKSTQAYLAAESGIEDILLRFEKNENWSTPYTLNVGGATTTVDISDIVGGTRTVTSEGDLADRIRKLQLVYQITADEISFRYGAQVGDGGMEMDNNSRIKGNVFSNGSVVSPNKGYIDGTIKVATIGSKIEELIVQDDAYTHNCKNCTIGGNLYFSGGSKQNCTSTLGEKSHPTTTAQALPISQELIDKWKDEAELGGVIVGDYTVPGGATVYLGPKKITGTTTIENNATLILTGTLWVENNIIIKNGATVKLDPGSYWGLSGIFMADGKISIKPGVSLEGSGIGGSYLLLLSTNSSLVKTSPAIEIDNTTAGGIFYANNGLIVVKNNVEAREVTAYQVYLEENAEVNYETGLMDTEFSSGPGGSWEVGGWREVE